MPYAENEGTKIYWDERGAGQPLLLIMGLGSTSDLWYRLLPTLSAHYRTILFDNRGVGRSDPASGIFEVFEVPPGKYRIGIEILDPTPQDDKLGGKMTANFSPIVRDVDGKTPIDIDLAKPQ